MNKPDEYRQEAVRLAETEKKQPAISPEVQCS